MTTKALAGVEIKNADKGEVQAVFATFDVVDKDGDVTLSGAFEEGAPVRISAYGHTSWGGALPVGKGTIRTTQKEAILDGTFFLNTTAGRDTFEVVKQLGADGIQEWSYGFDIDGPEGASWGKFEDRDHVQFLKKLKVHEVSPVLLGAGVDTRVLATKSHQRFTDEADAVMAAVNGLTTRAADVMAMRREKGKGLSPESAGLLERVQAELKQLAAVLDIKPVPTTETDPDALREWLHDVRRTIA